MTRRESAIGSGTDGAAASPAATLPGPTVPGVELRPVTGEHYREWLQRARVAFGFTATEDDSRSGAPTFPFDRAIAAWADGAIVGTAVNYDLRLTVPGGAQVGCAGVSQVTVAPTHRRKGLLRAMMQRLMADALARGEVAAALYASEGTIYGRFGYGTAAHSVEFDIAAEAVAFRSPPADAPAIRLLPRGEAAQLLPVIHERVATRTVGSVGLHPHFWHRWDQPDTGKRMTQVAVLGPAGAERGYVIYRSAPDWRRGAPALPNGTLTVEELVGVDTDAVVTLWRYVTSVDLNRRFRARMRPVDDPLLLALANPLAVVVHADEPLWLRLLDVQAALRARAYAAEDTLVLRILDASQPHNEGCWRIDARGGRGEVARTEDEPDLQLDVAELAALYLGGTPAQGLCSVGRITERTPGAAERADALFRTWPAPWNGHHF